MTCNCDPNTGATTQATTGRRVTAKEVFKPAVDIYEAENEFVVLADVPGVAEKDIDVRFEEGTLTILARVADRPVTERRPLVREYAVGDYERSFRIGEGVDVNAIAAELKNGVLTLRLPKSERAKSRTIKVQTA